jgi:hypothetical protein
MVLQDFCREHDLFAGYDHGWFYYDLQLDMKQTEALAEGKGKDVTMLYLVHFYDIGTGKEDTRFVVLTRERGGDFEIVSEGEWSP